MGPVLPAPGGTVVSQQWHCMGDEEPTARPSYMRDMQFPRMKIGRYSAGELSRKSQEAETSAPNPSAMRIAALSTWAIRPDR